MAVRTPLTKEQIKQRINQEILSREVNKNLIEILYKFRFNSKHNTMNYVLISNRCNELDKSFIGKVFPLRDISGKGHNEDVILYLASKGFKIKHTKTKQCQYVKCTKKGELIFCWDFSYGRWKYSRIDSKEIKEYRKYL